jgi:hypothetical protein
MGIFEEMMQQYQDSHKIGGAKKSDNKYDLKNYFNAGLPKGVNELKKKIRILPPEEGKKTSFGVMYGHTKKVNGDYKTFPCLKHEKNEECPFCQAREALLAGGTEEEKELAKEYSARKFYIVKVIDRDNEADGVKFWRIKHNYKKEGHFDKIMDAIANAEHDITDPETGIDLNITIKRNGTGSAVTILTANSKSPLTTDEEKLTKWTSDTRTWEDVYSVRNYDYLAIIVKGETPVWDKEENRWVAKAIEKESDGIEDEVDMEDELPVPTEAPKKVEEKVAPKTETKAAPKVVATDDEDEDDDLPF